MDYQSTDKKIFIADNLEIMRRMPDECIDLIATDPPFNTITFQKGKTGSKKDSYEDTWAVGKQIAIEEKEGMVYVPVPKLWENDISDDWLVKLTPIFNLAEANHNGGAKQRNSNKAFLIFSAMRILEMYRILKPTGSLYWHCDAKMNYYLRLLLETVFGAKNFKREIIWNSGSTSGFKSGANNWIRQHDTILFFTKSNSFTFNKQFTPYSQKYIDAQFTKVDEQGRRYRQRSHKRYYANDDGTIMGDVWSDILSKQTKTQDPQYIGYATEKPIELYRRIIRTSSNEGDLVLDPFAGCTTTLVAAEIEGRRWLGIDINKESKDNILTKIKNYIETLEHIFIFIKLKRRLNNKPVHFSSLMPVLIYLLKKLAL